MNQTKFVRAPSARAMAMMGIPDLPEEAFGGMKPIARAVGAPGITLHKGGGGGLMAVVGVVAAIAIPFAAPAIAASIGASASIGAALTTAGISAATAATAGSVIGSAIVGAGLGAVTAAVTGQNVGRAALMGGIGGGIGGYMAAPSVPQSAISPQAMTAANASSDPIAALNASQGWTATATPPANLAITTGGEVATMGPNGWMVNGAAVPGETIAYGGQVDSALAAQLSASGDVAGAANAINSSGTLAVNTPAAAGGNAGYLGTTNYSSAASLPQAGLAVTPQAEAAASVQAAYNPQSYQSVQAAEAAKTGTVGAGSGSTGQAAPAGTATGTQAAQQAAPTSVWQALQQKFTDPKQQADLLLRAAGQLAGSALAGDGLTPEQQQLVNQQTEELKQLKETNKELFDQRLSWAQGLLGESRYFDPEYFGLQSQRGVQTTGARAKREAMRKLAGKGKAGLRAAEERRYDLGIATGGESAYLQGADTAQQNKIRTMQAGLAQMPTGSPEYSGQYAALQKAYSEGEAARNTRAQNIGTLFGDFTGARKAGGLNLSFS